MESSTKFLLAFILVYVGWEVYGSLFAITVGLAIAFLISLVSVRDILSTTEKSYITPRIYNYAWSVFFVNLTIVMFYTIDAIIVKLLFSSEVAGYYAIASILAKTMLWGTQPITKALFPISSESTHKSKVRDPKLYRNALLILFLILGTVLLVFYLFPEWIIQVFSGKVAEPSVEILLYLTITMALVSIANLTLFYRLSYDGIKNYSSFIILIILEVITLIYFSSSLVVFCKAYLVISIIFLIVSLFNYKK